MGSHATAQPTGSSRRELGSTGFGVPRRETVSPSGRHALQAPPGSDTPPHLYRRAICSGPGAHQLTPMLSWRLSAMRRHGILVSLAAIFALVLAVIFGQRIPKRERFRTPPFSETALRLWSRFVVDDAGRVILPINDRDTFRLYAYRDGGRELLLPESRDVIDAFFVGDRVIGLADARGDNRLVPTDAKVAALLSGQPVERVWSAPGHRAAVILSSSGRSLHWIDFDAGSSDLISPLHRFQGM